MKLKIKNVIFFRLKDSVQRERERERERKKERKNQRGEIHWKVKMERAEKRRNDRINFLRQKEREWKEREL